MTFIRDTAGNTAALRARADELNVTREEIDRVVGWSNGYAGKVLCVPPIKDMTLSRYFELLGALGLAIQFVDDPLASRYTGRMEQRDRKWVRKHAIVSSGRIPWLFKPENAREMGIKGGLKVNAQRSVRIRKKLAKQAALIRWEKVKSAVKADSSSNK